MTEAQFADLLAEHAGMLARIASLYEPRQAQRDDLLQEIAFAVWKAVPRFRGESSLRTFIARIAHNCGVDHLIARRRDALHGELPESLPDRRAGPEHETYREQQQRLLREAVARLPLGQRQAVALALDGFAHAEISEVLGISVNNVDVRLARARAALKRFLKEKT